MDNNDALSVSSMNTLILWNISKAVERNPDIDLKIALKAAQVRLELNAHDVKAIISQYPEERHLACALLAWQQLGHNDSESLYRFVTENEGNLPSDTLSKDTSIIDKFDVPLSTTNYETPQRSKCFDTNSLGPVIKLPVDTKIVMRMDGFGCPQSRSRSRPRTPDKTHIKDKIKKACCLEPGCANQLATLDNQNSELKSRATKLAMREAERVRLLERAETAWRDLEISYQRRLTLAEEKEADITKQINKIIEERNNYKMACMTLAENLKKKSDVAEKETGNLNKVEKTVCEKACLRLSLMETAMKEDANLCDAQCKAAQLDRDLQFKEEQARRKLQNLKSELDSSRTLTFEAERAMRAELTGLREQIVEVSKQLLADDNDNTIVLKTLEELREEKMEIIEDLEGCKGMCDNKMQAKINEAKAKKDQLTELKNKVVECKCKIPIDEGVEVKRTPSLAAICQCSPEDRLISPCSCTSLRTSLLSTMLCDMFGGLQSELGTTGAEMPCQLLKCLEDKHNWERSSGVVTNLRNFFSKLLLLEMDIAVANSIEKYHAKWVGASCADDMHELIEPNKSEGWQKRAIEREAQKLATQLADKMFEEKAKELAERAKAIASENEAPPCECQPDKPEQALYSVMVEPPTMSQVAGASTSRSNWKNTPNDVTMLRAEIENLKKESIKKEDLKIMEKEIAKIIQLASYWSDCKCKIKKKGSAIRHHGGGTGGGPAWGDILAPIEERILALMGVQNVAGNPNVSIPVDINMLTGVDSPTTVVSPMHQSMYVDPAPRSSHSYPHDSDILASAAAAVEPPVTLEHDVDFYVEPAEVQEVQPTNPPQNRAPKRKHRPNSENNCDGASTSRVRLNAVTTTTPQWLSELESRQARNAEEVQRGELALRREQLEAEERWREEQRAWRRADEERHRADEERHRGEELRQEQYLIVLNKIAEALTKMSER